MARRSSRFWSEGFQAGRILDSRCPYRPGSREAKDWLEGWAVGLHEYSPVLPDSIRQRTASRWPAWLRSFLGR